MTQQNQTENPTALSYNDRAIIQALDRLINEHPDAVLKPDPELIRFVDELIS